MYFNKEIISILYSSNSRIQFYWIALEMKWKERKIKKRRAVESIIIIGLVKSLCASNALWLSDCVFDSRYTEVWEWNKKKKIDEKEKQQRVV